MDIFSAIPQLPSSPKKSRTYKKGCPPEVRARLSPVLDEALLSENGKYYYSSNLRYDYRFLLVIIDEECVESIMIYPQDHPLYAAGVYSNLAISLDEPNGRIAILKTTEPVHITPTQLLIPAAVTDTAFTLVFEPKEAVAFVSRLQRARDRIIVRYPLLEEHLNRVNFINRKGTIYVGARIQAASVEDIEAPVSQSQAEELARLSLVYRKLQPEDVDSPGG